jgi:hypothetical protein
MEKIALQSLSSDLKRISLSIQRNSLASAIRFNTEAERWLKESRQTKNRSILNLLEKVESSLRAENDLKKAEDCLMYATLLQNKTMAFR